MFPSIGKWSVAIIIGMFFITCLLGEKSSGIKGSIVDRYHAPIRNVYVLVHRNGITDKAVHTDEGGKYSIELSPNLYDIFISADGFAPTCRKIEITPDGMMIFNPVLTASEVGMEQ